MFVRCASAMSVSGNCWNGLIGARGFFSATYARMARWSRWASASPATALTWRESTTPPAATAEQSVRIASALLPLLMTGFLLLLFRPRHHLPVVTGGRKERSPGSIARGVAQMQQDVAIF